MASHKRVLHVERGFRMSKSFAEQVMRDHCTFVWVSAGESVRDATGEERRELMANREQQKRLDAAKEDYLSNNEMELKGVRFEKPKGAKSLYSREAYDDLEKPMNFPTCRWPQLATQTVQGNELVEDSRSRS